MERVNGVLLLLRLSLVLTVRIRGEAGERDHSSELSARVAGPATSSSDRFIPPEFDGYTNFARELCMLAVKAPLVHLSMALYVSQRKLNIK